MTLFDILRRHIFGTFDTSLWRIWETCLCEHFCGISFVAGMFVGNGSWGMWGHLYSKRVLGTYLREKVRGDISLKSFMGT